MQPNVLLILTDDQGYGDLSFLGTRDIRTPHLDKLAQNGILFRSWYSNSPVCSPSRASLLTGRYPHRAGVRGILGGRRTAVGLRPDVATLADVLGGAGYRTAMLGKWHLGQADGCRPENHGFQHWFGFMAGNIDYFSHIHYFGSGGYGRPPERDPMDPIHDLWEDGKEVHQEGGYFTDLITERAVAQVRAAASDKRPLFLYLPYNAPHYPMHAPRHYVERFAEVSEERRMTCAMIAAVDDGVGAILEELERQGMRDDTLVIFSSDNGPSRETRNWLNGRTDPYMGGSAGEFRAGKASLFEGGIRVPGIVNWPGHVAGGAIFDDPIVSMDILPTIASMAGCPIPDGVDGLDVSPWLAGEAAAPERDLFWELGGQTAVRRGDWKLVLKPQLDEFGEAIAPHLLSNVANDPGEQTDLSAREPGVFEELRGVATDWRDQVEADWREYAAGRPAPT